jgi:hypothetical protein
MTAPPSTPPTTQRQPALKTLLPWLPIAIGLAVLYVPSLVDLFIGIWSSDEQMHGPIVLGISLWLLYRNWPAMEQAAQGQPTSNWGWPVFVFGLLLYALGRSQDILLFEIGSVIWLLVGLALLQRGAAALKVQWFALFFMLFMVPLPGAVVDAVTMPMKMAVSYVAENILYWAGCPKQELWMAEHRGKINAVMIGVGAAFDYHAETIKRAPLWMQQCGLEWLHRLASEPRRLWRRYLITNTLFTVGAIKQAVGRITNKD